MKRGEKDIHLVVREESNDNLPLDKQSEREMEEEEEREGRYHTYSVNL